jgi:hypothetical protein
MQAMCEEMFAKVLSLGPAAVPTQLDDEKIGGAIKKVQNEVEIRISDFEKNALKAFEKIAEEQKKSSTEMMVTMKAAHDATTAQSEKVTQKCKKW